MLPTPRLALVWIGIWFALTLAGWLLSGLIGGKWSEDADVSLLMAMMGAALVTYALQFLVFLGDALGFLFDLGGVALRRIRGLKRRV